MKKIMKKEIRVRADFYFDWLYGVSLKKIKEDIDALEEMGVTEIEIEPDDSYDNNSVSIEAYCTRLETDEELEERMGRETKRLS